MLKPSQNHNMSNLTLNQMHNMNSVTNSISFDAIINNIEVIMKNPYVLGVLAVLICLIIIFMMINTAAKSNIVQWFIWIFLFIYLTIFITLQFYLVPSDTFSPYSAAMIASLFIYLFPSPLFNTRKNKSSTQWISIGYSFLLLLTSFLMINGYSSRIFKAAHSSSSILNQGVFNYCIPFFLFIVPSFYYWGIFY